MVKTGIQRAFAPLKAALPRFVWERIRMVATAVITPLAFSLWSGHFRSSLRQRAVSRKGEALPWYTYPCIHLLEFRDFGGKRVLEFGGGQSTLWWAARAERVVTIEEDAEWYGELGKHLPGNVELHLVPSQDGRDFLRGSYLAGVTALVAEAGEAFDVVVIDGYHFRGELVGIALGCLAEDGAVICDDSEGYGIHEATRDRAVSRVDFFGHQPGVVLPHCTSIVFGDRCFLFDPRHRIPDVATEAY